MEKPCYRASSVGGGGQILPSAQWGMEFHEHDHHELIVLLEGRMQVRGAKGQVWKAQAGELLIYPAGVAHEESSDAEAPVRTLFFSFHGEAPEDIRAFSGTGDRVITLARFLFHELIASYPNLNQTKLCAYLNLMALELSPPRVLDVHAQLVDKANLYLADHYSEPVQLEDLARACHCSKFHFARIYKEQTGLSPMRALKQLRIQQAQELLRTSLLSLSAIAEQCGFSNEYHLSREFKRITGLGTRDFRKRQQSIRS